MKTNLTKAVVAIPLALTMIIPCASPIFANDGMDPQDSQAQVQQQDNTSQDTNTTQSTYSYQIYFVENTLAADNMPASLIGNTDDISNMVSIPNDIPTAAGYTFQGWTTQDGSGNVEYRPGDVIDIDHDTVLRLFPVWTQNAQGYNFQINYIENNLKVSGMPGTQSGQTNGTENQVMLSSSTPKADGYTFQGWSTKEGGSVEYKPEQMVDFTQDTTLNLYAVWTKDSSQTKTNASQNYKFEINYIENHLKATGMPSKQSGETNDVDNFISLSSATPKADGYTFQGWSTKDGGSVEYKAGQTIDIEKDTTLNLYAVWTKDTAATGTGTVQTGAETNIGIYAGVTGVAAALLAALGLKKKFNK